MKKKISLKMISICAHTPLSDDARRHGREDIEVIDNADWDKTEEVINDNPRGEATQSTVLSKMFTTSNSKVLRGGGTFPS